MSQKNKTPERGHAAGASDTSISLPRHDTKLARVLSALASGRSLNRWEAAREYHDWCLHSTVSAIERRYGISVSRKEETVSGYRGHPTRCCRYWLGPDEQTQARQLVGGEV